jgi:hypothetical protein
MTEESKKPMTLKRFAQIINECVERADPCDPPVEVWYKKKGYHIDSIGQFSVIPTVTITIGEKICDLTDLD